MNLKGICLCFSLAISPMSMAKQQLNFNHPPADFHELFEYHDTNINIDLLYIEQQIANMLERTSLSLEHQTLLGQAIFKLIDEANQSRVLATWRAATELRQVCLDIRTQLQADEEPRLVFDYLITIVQLIIAAQEANLSNLIDSIATVIVGVIAGFFD